MNLVWKNLTVNKAIGGSPKKLLNDLSGFAEPGRIMAIMGPSGSGKSTLLDSLAGRLSVNLQITGKVLLNGKERRTCCNNISYVTQEDIFLGTLTVRETIMYSAHLRLPSKMTTEEIISIVENVITEMGLQDCANTKIGNWHVRGISTGEKKRLSIGLEMITQPHILFLDEPTTGLDSASAFFAIRTIKNIAYDGKIVICSIHQPSGDVFSIFDDLLLLSSGETVYFGEVPNAIKFFAEAGFPCPPRRNPSDHFLQCICLDFDNVAEALSRSSTVRATAETSTWPAYVKKADIRAILVKKYKNSELFITTQEKIKQITAIREVIKLEKGSSATWWKQFCTLTRRSFVNMHRDIGYYWLRMFFYVSVSIVIGTLFFNIGLGYGSVLTRVKGVCFIYGFMICLSSGGSPFFIEEMKVFHRERLSGHYGESAYVLANFFSSLPFLIMMSFVSGTTIYYMVKFHPGFSHYAFFCIDLFCCVTVIESCMMVVASLVPNVLMSICIGTGLIIFLMMASEMTKPLSEVPKFFWRYPISYISFANWAIQGQYKNDMIGLEFEPFVPGGSKVKGEIVLVTLLGIPLGHSKWWDLFALLLLLVAHRVTFYLVLKYKGRVNVSTIKLSGKKTLQYFTGRTSSLATGEVLSSSKRHQPRHSLSSQEGLTSPLPY